MEDAEIRRITRDFIKKVKRQGFMTGRGQYIALCVDKNGKECLSLSEKKTGKNIKWAFPFPDDLSEKPEHAVIDLAGIIYWRLKVRARNLKVAASVDSNKRKTNASQAMKSYWANKNNSQAQSSA